jgi:undecaprenyl-diphosphatase
MTARKLLPVAVFVVAVYVLLPEATHVHATIAALDHANLAWIAVVGIATVCTYLASSAAWLSAAPVPLALAPTFSVQLAAASVNRVTPAGLGGMATNMAYLRRAGATRAQAVTTFALNSGAGFVVHASALAAAAILGVRVGLHIPGADFAEDWLLLIVVTVGLAAFGAWKWEARLRRRLRPVIAEVAATAARVVARPMRSVALLGASFGVTASYAAAFAASAYAYGAHATLLRLAVVYLGASAVAAATPTPGGLGALDAGLVAGLGAAGARPGPAVAAVLTYRTVTYWLPVIPGVFAHRNLRKSLRFREAVA